MSKRLFFSFFLFFFPFFLSHCSFPRAFLCPLFHSIWVFFLSINQDRRLYNYSVATSTPSVKPSAVRKDWASEQLRTDRPHGIALLVFTRLFSLRASCLSSPSTILFVVTFPSHSSLSRHTTKESLFSYIHSYLPYQTPVPRRPQPNNTASTYRP